MFPANDKQSRTAFAINFSYFPRTTRSGCLSERLRKHSQPVNGERTPICSICLLAAFASNCTCFPEQQKFFRQILPESPLPHFPSVPRDARMPILRAGRQNFAEDWGLPEKKFKSKRLTPSTPIAVVSSLAGTTPHWENAIERLYIICQ